MSRFGIDSDTVPNPDLVGLADLHLAMPFHECDLSLQLAREPKIIGVEKSDIAPARLAYGEIPRYRNAQTSPREQSQRRTDLRQFSARFIRRAVVDDDQLKIAPALRQHGIDGFADQRPSIESRNDNADERRHRTARKLGGHQRQFRLQPLNKSFHLFEKLIDHHLSHAV